MRVRDRVRVTGAGGWWGRYRIGEGARRREREMSRRERG